MLYCAQRLMTRSRCLNPDSLSTRGFKSSARTEFAEGMQRGERTFKVAIVEWQSDAI